LGFNIVATTGTHKELEKAGVDAKRVLKISEGRPNIDDLIKNGEIDLAINTSWDRDSKLDGIKIRQSVLASNIAYCTTVAGAKATILAIRELKSKNSHLEPKALQDYLK